MKKALSRDQELAILRLRQLGKSQTEIGQIVGCSQPQVSIVLSELADTTQEARKVLRNGCAKLAKRVIDHANVEESLEVLDRMDVAPKKQRDTQGPIQVGISIGMPASPALVPPVIDLSPDPSSLLSAPVSTLSPE